MSDINEYNTALSDFMLSAGEQEIYSSLCNCGAITMSCYGTNDLSLSFKAETLPFIKPTNDIIACNCNHCVNNWGIDIEQTQSVLTRSGWEDLTELERDQFVANVTLEVDVFDKMDSLDPESEEIRLDLISLIDDALEVEY